MERPELQVSSLYHTTFLRRPNFCFYFSPAVCFAFSIVLSITLSFLYHDVPVIWTSGASGGLMLCGMTALTIYAIDYYKTSLRCSAVGLFVCVGHIAALIAKPLYALLPAVSPVAASIISSLIILVPFVASIILREPTTTLL